MANVVKYVSQTISVNSNSERLSTNGHYTGQHKGSITQDSNINGDNRVYQVEKGVTRYGTIMGDNASGSMPTIGVEVNHTLVGCSPASGSEADIYAKNGAKTFTFTADTNYSLTDFCKVYIGGVEATSGTDFTYTKGDGTVAFSANKLSADTVIDLRAKKSGEQCLIQKLTKCTSDTEDGILTVGDDGWSIVYTADTGKSLPSSITVKIGGATKTVTTDYTWTKSSGTLAIAAAKLTGDVEVTITAS